MHGPRGLSSRVSVTSHGSGGGFSVKDGAGGSLKTRKPSVAGSTTFSHSLVNLTQVIFRYFFRRSCFCFRCNFTIKIKMLNSILLVQYCVLADVDMLYTWFQDNVRISESYKQRVDILKMSLSSFTIPGSEAMPK